MNESHSLTVDALEQVFDLLMPAFSPLSEVDRIVRTWSVLVRAGQRRKLATWFEIMNQWSKNPSFQIPLSIQFEEPFFRLAFWDRILLYSTHKKALSPQEWFKYFGNTSFEKLAENLFEIRKKTSLLYELRPSYGTFKNAPLEGCVSVLKLQMVLDGWETWKNPSSWRDFLHLSQCDLCLKNMDALRSQLALVDEVLPVSNFSQGS